MENLNLKTHPTGRSPKGKFYFGENTEKLCKDRPNECQIGNESDFNKLYDDLFSCHYAICNVRDLYILLFDILLYDQD